MSALFAIDAKGIKKSFGKTEILKDVRLSLGSHGLYFITGENGVGKTTLLKIIGLLDQDYEGSLSVFGRETKFISESRIAGLRKKYFSYFLQGGNDISFLSSKANTKFRGACFGNDEQLDERESPSQGERVLAYLELALKSKKRILLLDEPTSNLSERNALKILDKLVKASLTKCVVVVTHDTLLINSTKGKVIKLENGKLNFQARESGTFSLDSFPKRRTTHRLKLAFENAVHDPVSLLSSLLGIAFFLFITSGVLGLSSLKPKSRLNSLYQVGDQVEILSPKTNWVKKNDGELVASFGTSFLTKQQFEDYLRSEKKCSFKTENAIYTNLPNNEICLIPDDSRFIGTIKNNRILIDGRYLPFEKSKNVVTPQVNLNCYSAFPVEEEVKRSGAFAFGEEEETNSSTVFNNRIPYLLVSPKTLQNRGETKDLFVSDEEMYVGEGLSSLADGETKFFLDYSHFDLGSNWIDFPDFSSIYPSGVKRKYEATFSPFLKANEMVVSERCLQLIGETPRFIDAEMTISNIEEDVSFALKEGTELRLCHLTDEKDKEREESILKVWSAYWNRKANQSYWFFVAGGVSFFLILTKVVTLLRMKNRKNNDFTLLRTFGYSSLDSSTILYSPSFLGDLFGLIIGVALTPYAIYMMNNGVSMSVGPIVIVPLIVAFLICVLFFAFFHRSNKKVKN